MLLRSKIALILGSIAIFGGGFVLWSGLGWHLMDDFCGKVVTSSGAAVRGDYLARHIAIVDALQTGDSEGAQKRLRFLIHTEAAVVTECHTDPECTKLVPPRFYDPELLQRASAMSNLTTASSARVNHKLPSSSVGARGAHAER